MSNTPGDWGSHRGISLANTAHSEVAPCLPLPSLPSFCGAADQELWFLDDQPSRPLNRSDIFAQASKIADLLQETDVSYLNLKHDVIRPAYGSIQPSALHDEVLRYNPDAFQDACRGPVEGRIYSTVFNRQTFQHNEPLHNQVQRDFGESHSYPHDHVLVDDIPSSSRKSQVKKKGSREISSTLPDPIKHQDAVLERFSEVLEDFLTGAEIPSEDQDDAEWLPLQNSDIRMLVNEVLSIRHEKMLHLVPVDKLARLLEVLDHQIHRAEGLSIDECEQSDSDVSSIFSALESIHAVLAVMTHNDMPKHLYKEEIIERILEFIRRQIMDVMSASDSSYRALQGPSENRVDGEEDEEADANYGSSSKKRRIYRSVKAKRTGNNRVSASVNAVLQKLCTILGFLKDLLFIERLPDSCILQLVKTSLSTLLVDNIQLLQLKAISLISGIFYSYAEHRTHIVDEVVLLLWKLPFSKRAIRAYHLQDEEQKQIQMVTALLLQLVHHSTNLPEALRQSLSCSTVLETTVDSSYLIKCHEAATETCVSFWTRILQRFTSVKSQDASELKSIMENLILDLLTTFNMPEYPASALILEVLSVLLLQNAGPKSKDTSVRSTAIEILGTIAARLKHDSALCGLDDFWIVQELACRENVDESHEKDTCSVCMDGKTEKLLAACQGCQKLFHADCMGVRELDISTHSWHCPICLSRKQLLVLQSYCKSQSVNKGKNNQSRLEQSSEAGDSISKVEIVQQILLNYLQDAGSADDHLFARWFYLCLWYKDDPKSRHKFSYRLASLNSKSIVRDSGVSSSMLARDSIKKITSALGQKSSFSRGFDTILCMLLVSLRENSPVIRAKTLRAVSMIVEADPDVLCDKRVQSAVEGRFCDSAISVREAALELVGRYIASHPDVGLKYFEKVAERVKDTGVSVRKRAIKIIREMCISNVNFIEFPRACIDIISRVTDEESSIQDLVCKTFFEFWFEEPSDAPTQFFGDSSSVPLEVAKKTEQIVDMLKKMPNHQPLVTVIKRNLALDFVPQSAKAAGINPVSLATVHKRCELMCKYLLERILQVEEMDKEEGEVRALPYVMLLHAFCIVDPTLCAPASDPSQFVVTLQPYLKNQVDNRVVAQLLESIIFVIDAVLPLIRRLPSSVVEELEQDLKQMIVRHSFLTVVHACIKCLCTVSKIVGKRGTLIEFLIQVFFKHLDALGLDNKQLVGRSLFCLGLLIRYGHSFLSDSNRYIDVISSLSLFKKYLLVDDFVIKVRALQALGFVLIARPECMLEKDVANILAATLSSACDARLKLQSLQNMYEYLLDAESKMETDKVGENEVDCSVKGGSSVPVAAGAGDTNICGGIVQLYWDNILERSLDINEQVRQLGLKIVEVVLRQGLVHPITCVPYLVALETDHLESNSKLAHHLLMNMNEKYPSFFESRLGDGLQLSFIFMQSINEASENLNMKHRHTLLGNVKGKSDDSSFSNARLGVSRIYKLIRGNRVARNKFMSSVVRKFDNPRWSDTVIPFLKYCTDILALLPFTSPDEPLYLIYVINRVIQVRSGTLEANLKALSLHFSQRGSQKIVHENGIAQQESITDPVSAPTMLLEVNGTIQQEPWGQHFPIQSTSMDANMHSANFGDSHVINEDDLQKIQDVSIAATALQLLLKLKRHLKIVYSLDNVRCQAFSPTDPPKPGEVLSKQNIPLNIHGIHDDLPSTSQELTQRYQDLKNALKEDTMDYSAYTANIKRKRPPSRRGGRSARLTGRDVEDDADDDDDEEWTDGMRRPNRSGRQGSSFRGTRPRS